MVLPAPAKIQKAQKNLDYEGCPDNPPEKVQCLCDSLQRIAYRLQALELAHDRIARHAPEVTESLASLGSRVRETLENIFACWARFEAGDAFEQRRGSLQHASRDFHQEMEAFTAGQDRESIGDQTLGDIYTLLGSLRGLIDAMANAQAVINQINWPQWTAARF